MSCIDLIFTDQPNLIADSGVHPSLDKHCQHQIVLGKVNISPPYPSPYYRTLWDYVKAIKDNISSVDWISQFDGLDTNQMVELFTNHIYSIM